MVNRHMKNPNNSILVTLTGPSCSGKTTLQKMMQDIGWNVIVSFTSRSMREGEIHLVDYEFLSDKEIEEVGRRGGFAESVEFNGNMYGITKRELETKLILPSVVVVEPHGVQQLHKYCIEAETPHVAVFVSNPPTVNAARFLERYKNDSKAKSIDYARRLTAMYSEERDWIHDFNYDLIFNSFDSNSQDEVLSRVLSEAERYYD